MISALAFRYLCDCESLVRITAINLRGCGDPPSSHLSSVPSKKCNNFIKILKMSPDRNSRILHILVFRSLSRRQNVFFTVNIQ